MKYQSQRPVKYDRSIEPNTEQPIRYLFTAQYFSETSFDKNSSTRALKRSVINKPPIGRKRRHFKSKNRRIGSKNTGKLRI
jgi:hypothetical protein